MASLTPIEQSVLKTLTYADVFDYPLTTFEIYQYLLYEPTTHEQVKRVLSESPVLRDLLQQHDGYYALPDRAFLIPLRKKRHQIARQKWKTIERCLEVLQRVPFIKMIGVSGGLAMNNVESEADIDLMFITEVQQLWTTRFGVQLVKRILELKNRHLHLCPNYFITENDLSIYPQNLFTAHEVAQMVPLYNQQMYYRFIRQNRWINRYLPNYAPLSSLKRDSSLRQPKPLLQRFFRWLPEKYLRHWQIRRTLQRNGHRLSDKPGLIMNDHLYKGQAHNGSPVLQLYQQRLKSLNRYLRPYSLTKIQYSV